MVAVPPGAEAAFAALCAAHGVPAEPIGTVGGDQPGGRGLFTVPLAELRRGARAATLPALFG